MQATHHTLFGRGYGPVKRKDMQRMNLLHVLFLSKWKEVKIKKLMRETNDLEKINFYLFIVIFGKCILFSGV